MRQGLLAVLAIWLTVLSQGAFALSCSIGFSTPENTTQTYTLTGSENRACDPTISGIANDAVGNDYSNNPTVTQTTGGGQLKVYGSYWSGFNQLVYTPPSPTFVGTDTALFYVTLNGVSWTQTGTVTITVTGTAPTVTNVSPTSGTTAGGTSVTLMGTNFSGATGVSFGGAAGTGVIVNSATSISVTSPAHAAGAVDITVTTAVGTSSTSGSDQFMFVAPAVANAVSATVVHGSSGNNIPLSVTGGTATSVAVSTAASHGTATASGTTISYTPNASFSGTDTFAYTATDGAGTSSPATATITVSAPTISYAPSSPAGGTVGTAYSQSLASASGGTSPYTYAVTSGSLPAGITLASNGTLAGTPTAGGSFNFTVKATDSSTGTGPFNATSGTLTLVIAAPTISVSPTTLAAATVASAYSSTITASGGTSTYSYAITAGALPAGLSLNSGTGVVSGTPTQGGSFNFTVTATDSSTGTGPYTGSRAYTLAVNAPTISLSPTTLSAATVASAYSSNITASGGTGPYTYAVTSGALPAGLTLSSGGVLSGTPTQGGSFNFTVTATDSSTWTGPYTGSRAYTLTVAAATVTLSPTTLPSAAAGSAYSQTVTASGGTPGYTYAITAGSLPTGLTMNSAGALSGTPTAGGTFNFTITATDSSTGNGPYTGSRAYSLTVGTPTISVSPSSLSSATVASAYSSNITASGGTSTYTYAITSGSLPAGLSLSSGGALSGTPTAAGTFNFTVTATDSSTGAGPYTGSRAYSLTVAAPTLAISPTSGGSLSGSVSTAYSQTFTASNGTAPYTYALSVNSGTMPTGLSFNTSTGVLSGTPTSAGSVNFTVTGVDSSTGTGAPFSVSGTYTLTTAAPTITLSPSTLPAPVIGAAYSQTVTGGGGTAPYTYAVTAGALPAGLSLNTSTGAISGTPTAGGAYSFTIKTTDANSFNTTRTYSGTVASVTVAVNPGTMPGVVVGTAYNQSLSASGGTAPYTYAITAGALPAGMTLTSAGVLSGTPTASGSFSFTVKATDSSTGTGAPYFGTHSYTIVVGQVIGTAPATTVTTLSNAPLTLHPTANATGGPFSSVVIVSPPASGTAVVNGLDIVYTPALTTSGAVNFTYALVNTAGTSAPIPVTINVNAVPVPAAQKQASTLSGQSVSVDLTDGATGGPFTGATLVSVVPSNAGTASIVQKAIQTPAGLKPQAVPASTYVLNFTPSGTYNGQAVLTYMLSNAFATSAPATVQVSVTARRDPSTDPDVAGLINAQIQAARRFATTQVDNYNRRLEALHGTGRAPSNNGLTVAMPGQRVDMQARCQDVPGIAAHDACLRGDGQGLRPFASGKRNPDAANGNGDKSNADAGPDLPGADAAGADADSTDPRLAFWSAGTLDFGFANTGAQRSGFRFTTGGVTAGADYRVSDQFSVGAGFGYGRDSTDIGNAGTKSTGDSYSLALYGSYRPLPSLFVDGVAGFGTLSFDSRRWVTDANDFATGKRNGKQMFASVSAGYEHRDRTWLISPYGRLSVSQSTLDQFSESGAGLNALTYFEQTVTTVSGTLGLRAEYTQKTKWGTFLPFARVEYQHDFNGQSNAGLAYADLASSGPAYYVPGTPFGRDRVQIGLGTKFRTGPLTFGLDYNVTTGMGGLQQGVRLTFAAPF